MQILLETRTQGKDCFVKAKKKDTKPEQAHVVQSYALTANSKNQKWGLNNHSLSGRL